MNSRLPRRAWRISRWRRDGVIISHTAGTENVIVTKQNGQIVLYFGESDRSNGQVERSGVMSRVLLRDPLHLLGIYTRVMMLALAWRPEPHRVYLLGFGGGRLPAVLHANDRKVVIECTETSALVVDLAQRYFGVRLDERLQVFVEDGRAYLEKQPTAGYDIIWIDCFTGTGRHPSHLSTTEFYALCCAHLADGGVVVTNLSQRDILLARKIATFGRSFASCAAYRDRDCCVLFGWNDSSISLAEIALAAREYAREHEFSFAFAHYADELSPLPPMIELPSLRDDDPSGGPT